MMKRLFLMALTAMSCGPSVTLMTDRAAYQPGGELTLTLQNSSLAAIGYGLCGVNLINANADSVKDPDGGFCAEPEFELRGGQRATATRKLWASLAPATYHYRTFISFDQSSVSLVSNEFDVAP